MKKFRTERETCVKGACLSAEIDTVIAMLRWTLLVLAGCLISTISAKDERPNILLILSDDHSVPHLGAYDCPNCLRYGLTPNLDKFAKEGMRFDRAYTTAPQCAPSRTSIFAGRSPVGVRATRFAQPAQPHIPLFTDALRESGYWVGMDGRHQHLDGKIKDLPHVSEELEKLGAR
ncbi:MAG: sulfatase-like hydrolase/transferase, partial [Verrucomicrobiota bacterium]